MKKFKLVINENGNYITDQDGNEMVFENDQQALEFFNGADETHPDFPIYQKAGVDGFYDSYYDDERGDDPTCEFEKEYIK